MLRFWRIDLTVNSWNKPSAKLSLSVERLSVTLDVGITRCGHIEKKDQDTAR